MNKVCIKVKKLMSLYIDNELSDRKTEYVRSHVNTCDACKNEYNALRGTVSELNSLSNTSLPANFVEKLHINLAETVQKPAYIYFPVKYSAVLAGVVVFVFIIAGYYDNIFKTDITYTDHLPGTTYDEGQFFTEYAWSLMIDEAEEDVSENTEVVDRTERQQLATAVGPPSSGESVREFVTEPAVDSAVELVRESADESVVRVDENHVFSLRDNAAPILPQAAAPPEVEQGASNDFASRAPAASAPEGIIASGSSEPAAVPLPPPTAASVTGESVTEYVITTDDEVLIAEINKRYNVSANVFTVNISELNDVIALLSLNNAFYILTAQNDDAKTVRFVISNN